MKLSARNQLRGKVVEVREGATTGHVRIDVGGNVITASITNEAIAELQLKVGDDAVAVIKASDVMVGVDQRPVATVYEYEADSLDGQAVKLSRWRGDALLVVNTASRCGFTPQYTGLDALHRAYAGRGFTVLGFPCNQFGGQEPGDAAEIARFCSTTYDVGFPMFAKVEVNGPGAHPLFRFLKSARRGLFGTAAIKWNFTKFLVGRDGQVVARYGPTTKPDRLRGAIEAALGA